MSLRQFVVVTHRWAGLLSSVIVAIAGVTGAVLVWERVLGQSALRRASSRLHDTLALGYAGGWMVFFATAAAVYLTGGGLYLWWKTKRISVRWGGGWQRICHDLHYSIGAVLSVPMFAIAFSAVAMRLTRELDIPIHPWLAPFHLGGPLIPIKVLYTIASFAFFLQGFTGVIMWLRVRR